MKKSFKAILFLTLFISQSILAHETKDINFYFPYTQYSTLDGLPSNETHQSFKDSNGYIWIATDKGVSRFNGYEFENFTTSNGLIDNTIFAITEDHKNRVWFAGFNAKLGYYENNKFHEYPYNDKIKSLNTSDNSIIILSFEIDDQDNVYLGFLGKGYIIINANGDIIEQQTSDYNNIYSSQLTSPIEQNNSHIIFGKKLFNNIYLDYIINREYDNKTDIHLVVNDTLIHSFKNQDLYIPSYNRYRSNSATTTSYLKNNEIVFFNQYGLTYNKKKNFKVGKNQDFKLIKKNKTYLKYNKEGLWILNDNLEEKLKILDFNNLNLSSNLISSITEIETDLWINTINKGIFIIKNYKDPYTINLSTPKEPIVAIVPQKDGIYFKSYGKNNYYILKNNKLHQNTNQFPSPEIAKNSNLTFYGVTLLNNTFNGVKAFAKNDDLYFCSRKTLYKKTDEKIEKICISDDLIFSLIHYKDTLIIGTQNGLKYLNENNEIVNYFINKNNFKNHRIQDLKVVNDILIIATRGDGLYFNTQEKTIHLNEIDGLASNIINHLFLSENNNLWVASNLGVNKIVLKNINQIEITRNINLSHGIPSPDVKQIYVENSKVYLVCDIGISIVNLKKLQQKDKNLPVYFKEIRFNDNSYFNSNLTDTILEYNQNNLLFRYTTVTLNSPKDINYRFKLIGLDKDWRYSKDRYIRYNTLKPGKYTFIVQARNTNNNWSIIHPELNILIKPPFWRNPVIITFVLFTFIFTTYLIISYYFLSRRNQTKLRNRLNRIKQESLDAQMNPHFIYNSLNSIQSYILKNDKKLANKYLVKFSRLMRITFENSQNHYVNISDEIKALVLYLELEQMRFDIPFSYDISIDPAINQDECKIPTLLIQPFVENAIWHGINNESIEQGHITISIQLIEEKLMISIMDNGIGIDFTRENKPASSINHQSKGIIITLQRIELINKIENKKYISIVENLRDENGNSLGTIVKFTLPFMLNITNEN